MTKELRYLSQALSTGSATFRVAPGEYITPAPRTYKSPEHAQLANPAGAVYACELDEAADRLDVIARHDCYPLTLQEVRIPGIGAQAEGAFVLRDLGPREHHRYATHFRNDQLGGHHGGAYYSTLARALAGFNDDAAKELTRIRRRYEATAEATADA